MLITAAATSGTYAQYQAGDTFLYPRIGIAAANLSDNEMGFGEDLELHKSKPKAGLNIGLEGERFVSSRISLSARLFYANQGYRYADWGSENLQAKTFWNLEDCKTTLHYLQVPVMANGYLMEGLALKAGVQVGYLMKATSRSTYTEGTIEEGVRYVPTQRDHLSETMTDAYHNIDVSIPVGFSYEYNRIVLDLRYHFGLTNTFKNIGDSKNRTLTFTLGYQFEL